MSPKKNCKPNLIELYSSQNFVPTSADTKVITGVRSCDKVKLLIKFVSLYEKNYFKADVSLDVLVKSGNVSKKNISIRNICFKNELNVSLSSQTEEYKYLYDISCSSADNNDSSSHSCSSDISIESIINKNIEIQIATNIKGFIDSTAFDLQLGLTGLSVTLDVNQHLNPNGTPVFPTVRNTIKYKVVNESSSHSSSSSSCSSSSSKPNKIVKTIIIGAVISFVIMLIMNICKKNSYGNQYNKLLSGISDKVKGFISKSYSNIYTKPPVYVPIEVPVEVVYVPVEGVYVEGAPAPVGGAYVEGAGAGLAAGGVAAGGVWLAAKAGSDSERAL